MTLKCTVDDTQVTRKLCNRSSRNKKNNNKDHRSTLQLNSTRRINKHVHYAVTQQPLYGGLPRQTVQNMTIIFIVRIIATLHLVVIWLDDCCRPHSSVDEDVCLSTMNIVTATQRHRRVIALNPRLCVNTDKHTRSVLARISAGKDFRLFTVNLFKINDQLIYNISSLCKFQILKIYDQV